MKMILVLLLGQSDPPFRAQATIEETSPSGDWITRATGPVIVKPGEALVADFADRRLVIRGGMKIERRRGAKSTVLPAGELHPLELWLLKADGLSLRFEIVNEGPPGERELPEEAFGAAPIRARRHARSLAIAAEGTSVLMGFRLIPREESLKTVRIRAWREISPSLLSRVEVSTPTRRIVCALDAIRELESADESWFDPDLKPTKLEER